MFSGLRTVRMATDLELTWLRDFVSHRLVSADADQNRAIDNSILQELHRRGILQLAIPRKYGGREATMIDLACVARELAYGSMSMAATFAANIMGQYGVIHHGSEHVRLVACKESMRELGLWALAVREASPEFDYSKTQTVARESGAGFILNGEKAYVINASEARHLIVIARHFDRSGVDRGLSCFYVESHREGFDRGLAQDHPHWRKTNLGILRFRDVKISHENLLGQPGRGLKVLDDCINLGKTFFAASAVGAVMGTFDLALEWLNAKDHPHGEPGVPRALRPEFAGFPMQLDAGWLLVCRSASLWQESRFGEREATMAMQFLASIGSQVAEQIENSLVSLGRTDNKEAVKLREDMKGVGEFCLSIFARTPNPIQWYPSVSFIKPKSASAQQMHRERENRPPRQDIAVEFSMKKTG